MIRYTKILTLKGSYYVKDYMKEKKNRLQKRPVLEETVLKTFRSEDVEITVINQETGNEVVITNDSPKDMIRRYLGEKFAK